ncbi:hypothetical protein [uncultured Ilyobacter sp.]|uniref:hypothetical protein n=1 Tax=uncultured Ilyobacter sp. TaxID=544433 RepID=UPI0029C934A7|nr:hypothetical protein [uncultured Ilyobacter sp.]
MNNFHFWVLLISLLFVRCNSKKTQFFVKNKLKNFVFPSKHITMEKTERDYEYFITGDTDLYNS